MASRRTKITLIAAGALIAILAAVALASHILISRQDHELIKRQLASRVQASTGFELQINGPLELPYSLLPTVVLEDIVLNNPGFDGEKNLLEAEELRIRFAALPLIRGEILVYESSMSSVDLNLEVSKDGRSNWISGETEGTTGLPAQIAVHEVDLDNIRLSYRNLQTGVAFDARIDELNVQAPVFNDQIQMELLADLSGTPIKISGTLGSTEDIVSGSAFPVDLDIDIHDVDIEVNGQIDRIENGEINGFLLRLAAEGDDLREMERLFGATVPETKSFSAATVLSILDGALSASNIFVDIAWLGSELELAGDIANIRDLVGIDIAARVSGDDLPDISSLIDFAPLPTTNSYNLSGTAQGDWPAIGISEAQVSLRRNEITLEASGRLSDVANLAGLDVLLGVRGRNLSDLSQFVGQELPPTRTYHFSGRLDGTWPAISISAASAKLTRKNLAIDLAGSINNVLDLSGIDLNVAANGRDLSSVPELSLFEPPAIDRFEFEGRLTGSSSRLSIKGLEAVLEHGEHRLTLSGDVNEMPEFGGMDLKLTAAGTNPSELNAMLGLDLPPMQSYRLSAALAGDAGTLSARDVVIEGSAPGARLELRGDVGRMRDLHDLDLAMLIAIDGFSSLSPYFGTGLPESEPIELSGRLTGSVPDLNLDEFTMRSGDSLVMGSAGLRTGERLSIVGSVSSGVLDLRPYFLAARKEAEPSEETRNDRMFSDAPFDFSYLDAFDAQLRLDNLELVSSPGNVLVEHATIELAQGSLTIDPMELMRSDSTVSGHFVLDRQAQPEFDANLSIENVDLATFLQEIRLREVYEGRFDLTFELRSRGNSVGEVMANLNGELAAFVSEARVPGTSLSLRSIDLVIGMLPWMKRQGDLVVNCAISQLDVDDGIVNIELLYLDSAQMRMVGGGSIDLRAEEFDLRLAPRPTRSRILAHNIDLLVTGPFVEPKISSVGAAKAIATDYGKYALLGPLGLLVPTGKSQKHPCVGSLQEYRQQQAGED